MTENFGIVSYLEISSPKTVTAGWLLMDCFIDRSRLVLKFKLFSLEGLAAIQGYCYQYCVFVTCKKT